MLRTSDCYTWIDQHNTLGLGENMPISTGNVNDGVIVLNLHDGTMIVLRVPYPLGFYIKRRGTPRQVTAGAGKKGKGVPRGTSRA